MKKQTIVIALVWVLLPQLLVFGQISRVPRRFEKMSPNGERKLPPQYWNRLRTTTFQTKGSQLLDPCGSAVVLKGVNKMAVFDYNDPVGNKYFGEIAKTGANCVRIAWEMKSQINGNNVVNPLSRLDQLITNAKNQQLIPIVGLWDFTGLVDGGFSRLNEYVAYWTTPAMLALIQKHQAYLIVNIGNEAATGDEDTPAHLAAYANAYTKAVQQLRLAGIQVPLIIDGMDRGKSLKCFVAKGPQLLRADPLHNLIFSFHPYWPKSETDRYDNGNFIKNRFAEVRAMTEPITLMMGEISKYGAFLNANTDPCSRDGLVDYEQLVQQADATGMGWVIWEWGPGNAFYRPDGKKVHTCPNMDMTTNGTLATLGNTPGNDWARELAISATYSIKNTAKKTEFIKSGFTNSPLRP